MSVELPVKDRVIAAARVAFADRGFHATRLQDVAERAGLRHPTLLYHFGSKEGLYAAVIEDAFARWAAETEAAISTGLQGFDQVAALVEAAYRFFAEHQELARILRHETLAGGGRLEAVMVELIRPFFEQAVAFLRAEVAAGRLREHDPVELMQLCYASVTTYVSEPRFRGELTREDPMAPEVARRHREAFTALLRAALDPRG